MIDSVNGYILGSYRINNKYIDLDDPLIKLIASLASKGEVKLKDTETIIDKELIKNMINQHILSYDSKRNILKIVPKTSCILIDPKLIEKKITSVNEDKLLTESSKVDINSLTKKLENIGFEIISISTVFYPFYKAEVIDKDGGERYIYIDAITKHISTIP